MAPALRYAAFAGLASFLFPAFAAAATAAELVGLAAHRAVYEITLDKAKAGGGVSELTGRMVYELTGSVCEGYTQTMRFVTRMTGQDGEATINDLRSSTVEDVGTRNFKFSSSQYRNDQLSEAVAGDAKRETGDAPTKVVITKPKKHSIDVPASA
ncbi:MAG: DUF1849 family protein, partial [Hyphomicrobiaceae bacterium]